MVQLQEKDFIHEEYRKNPYPFWIWLCLLSFFVALLWGTKSWYAGQIQERIESIPFFQVTNREISLFLWQYPQHMRVHVAKKTGYLPAFQYLSKVTVEPELADDYVIAPPELLFLYHTWKRLLSEYTYEQVIPVQEFREFLNYAEEWQPAYWKEASTEYRALVSRLSDYNKEENLAPQLPVPVKQAFQGWRNYFAEGEQINQLKPTYEQVENFLKEHPHYARSYWRNLLEGSVPNYLKGLSGENREKPVPNEELAPFLKFALYNANKTQELAHGP